MENFYIISAKPIKHCIVEITTNTREVFNIDFFHERNLKDHEFDDIRNNVNLFFTEFSYDVWGVYWGTQIDVSIDELYYRSGSDSY